MHARPVIRRALVLVLIVLLLPAAVLAAFCPDCGKELPARARFCPGCGARVTAAASPDTPDRPAPKGERSTAPRRGEADDEAGPVGIQGGTLKVGSTPIACVVRFRNKGYEKTKPILLFRDVPTGRYTVSFTLKDRVVEKVVDVQPGKTTFVFGNLHSQAEAAAADEPRADRRAPAEPAAHVEQKQPTASPPFEGKSIQDADDKFKLAETLRTSVNPFVKKKRYEEAQRLYEEILERWPQSDKAEACHYQLGQIHESIYSREYREAIDHYKDVLRLRPRSTFDVRWRIAVLYDNRLGEKTTAREWYELAAEQSPSASIRSKAAAAAKDLRKRGF
jgi:TolA-binding protein